MTAKRWHKSQMAQTYADRYARVLAQLIDETIREETEVMGRGLINDISEYKQRSGVIQGLRKCLELMEEAESVISGKERT